MLDGLPNTFSKAVLDTFSKAVLDGLLIAIIGASCAEANSSAEPPAGKRDDPYELGLRTVVVIQSLSWLAAWFNAERLECIDATQ